MTVRLTAARRSSSGKKDQGEAVGEIFSLRAKDGEFIKTWISRATELFDRCGRKTGVTFPEEAKGWMLLNWAGLSEEQRAVVRARVQGALKRESVAQSMRSRYPDLAISKRKANAAAFVDEDFAESSMDKNYPLVGHQTDFQDVEQFLAEHHGLDEFEESDVAEILAATWKEKRAELSKLQKAGQFRQHGEARRSYEVQSLLPGRPLGP